MDLFFYVLAGAGVGLVVGMTGVGGGSLMTPLLLLLGCPLATAVGTDLVYAAVTKLGAVLAHQRQRTICWRIALLMSAGSLPSAVATVWWLHQRVRAEGGAFPEQALTRVLGFVLLLAAVGVLLRAVFFRFQRHGRDACSGRLASGGVVLVGLALGCLVTLSSVGAGACGTVALLVLCPGLELVRIVGTELAHAVPLALVAGCGHLLLGHVDPTLLCCLLLASLPASQLGARMARWLPDAVLQCILGSVLLCLGVRYALL